MRALGTAVLSLALVAAAPSTPRPAESVPLAADVLRAERVRIREAAEAILESPGLKGARVGVSVVSLATGETVFARGAEELLNPASNVKLVTAAAALARLGPEYRFATEFLCREPLRAGICGTLYVKGRGDPALFTERLYGIVGELAHRGVRQVGDIIVDDTYFDAEREGPGWEQENTDRPYMAPAGAVSINHNAVAIYVSAAESGRGKATVFLEPDSDFFRVDNQVQTAPPRGRSRVVANSRSAGDRQLIALSGRLAPRRDTTVLYKKVDNPPMYAGETLKAVLRERGVAVKGRVRLGVTPPEASTIYTSYSRALAEIVRDLNKSSNNFVAEQLLKSIGAEVMGTPGTWAKGVAAVEEYLAEIGIPKGGYVMKNGSGLNDTNRFSPAQLTRLLGAVAKRSDFFPEYASSLGIAARDGTLRSRMEGTAAAGRLRGKTGTLENVTALSGYLRRPDGDTYAYSILVNDFPTRHAPAVAGIDQLAGAIASGGRQPPREPPPPPDHPVAALAELKARVATFASLGQLADSRNLPFLRSLLRDEDDPVLRAVITDAIYRSDPESGVAGLIDGVPADSQTFARLRALGQELSVPTPLVSSLIDVAAEGHPDALDKLLLLARQASGDEGTAVVLSEGLQEIGRTAPDELYEALRRATEEVSTASLELLERGISDTPERTGHPFLDRLRAPRPEGAPATPALRMYERIQRALAEGPRPAAVPAPEPMPSQASSPAGPLPGG